MGVDLRAGLMARRTIQLRYWGLARRPWLQILFGRQLGEVLRCEVHDILGSSHIAQRRREHARRSRKQRAR